MEKFLFGIKRTVVCSSFRRNVKNIKIFGFGRLPNKNSKIVERICFLLFDFHRRTEIFVEAPKLYRARKINMQNCVRNLFFNRLFLWRGRMNTINCGNSAQISISPVVLGNFPKAGENKNCQLLPIRLIYGNITALKPIRQEEADDYGEIYQSTDQRGRK